VHPLHTTPEPPTMTTATPSLRIDFVSDIACPWCAIGLAALEQALARVQGDIDVELHIQPFELNPQLGPEGEDAVAHLQAKYGLDDVQLAANQERIRARGAELGIVIAPRRRIHNTFDAHRLLHWAGDEGRQLELKRALLRAYFTDGSDVADHATLVDIAAYVGLPGERARQILASDEFAAEVRTVEQFFVQAGITGVPATIVERRHLISGGQPVEVFEMALRQIAAAKAAADPGPDAGG
jgi:predicted DsbA family dithiol-disulfide isomerase